MNLSFTIDAEALARHVTRTGRDARSLRPVGFRLDSEGIARAVTLPGPAWLATMLSLGELAEPYRNGRVLLCRSRGSEAEPEPIDVGALVGDLRATLAALPDRADAEEAYNDLRIAAQTASARFGVYLLDVAREYVRECPALPMRPKDPEERAPAKTALERKHAERERRRAEERASARWALALYLDDEAPASGSRVSGSVVFDYVVEVLGYAVELFEETVLDPDPRDITYRMSKAERLAAWREIAADEWEHPAPDRPRLVSRRVLFAVADHLGAFQVTRPKGSVALTILRHFIRRLQESTVNVLQRAFEVLGTGPSDPEEYADEAVAEIRALAPAGPIAELDPRVLALPYQVAYAVAGEADGIRAFVRMARFHLDRHPEDRPAVVAVAAALKADDPDRLIDQIRARCVAEIDTEDVA